MLKYKHIHFYIKWVKLLSRVQLFVTPWTVAYQTPQPMEFLRQEYWSGLPFPSPRDLPNPGNEPGSPALQADALLSVPCCLFGFVFTRWYKIAILLIWHECSDIWEKFTIIIHLKSYIYLQNFKINFEYCYAAAAAVTSVTSESWYSVFLF